jgi:branched-chain amino acid transport system ATP-binding protein
MMTAPANGSAGESEPVVELRAVRAGYGAVTVLHDVDFVVRPAAVTAVVGANGAGKSTLLKVIAGLVRNRSGVVALRGEDVSHLSAHKRGDRGICLIPEGRGIFRSLTVRENLLLFSPPRAGKVDIEPAVVAFPVLGDRLKQLAGTLSGGEQQMLAVARAYLAKPDVILFDELSLGLAPVLLDAIFQSVEHLAEAGMSLVVVEQYVDRVLALADAAYILVRGQVSWHGRAADVTEDLLAASYLGRSA